MAITSRMDGRSVIELLNSSDISWSSGSGRFDDKLVGPIRNCSHFWANSSRRYDEAWTCKIRLFLYIWWILIIAIDTIGIKIIIFSFIWNWSSVIWRYYIFRYGCTDIIKGKFNYRSEIYLILISFSAHYLIHGLYFFQEPFSRKLLYEDYIPPAQKWNKSTTNKESLYLSEMSWEWTQKISLICVNYGR